MYNGAYKAALWISMTGTDYGHTQMAELESTQWVHVGMTHSAGNTKTYISGVVVRNGPTKALGTVNLRYIGAMRAHVSYMNRGDMAHLTFYDRVLTADEVEEHMDAFNYTDPRIE